MSQQLALLEERPIELDGFNLRSRGVQVIGRPTFDKFWAALKLALEIQDASPYWVGDLMLYAENRADYKDRLVQAIDATGYKLQTIYNLTSICRHVDEETRALAPSPSHSAVVASLPKEEQVTWLEEATVDNLNVRDFRRRLRHASRRAVIDGQAHLVGHHRVIYADPAWLYRDRQPSGSSTEDHYLGLTIEEICALPVEAHAMPNAVLAMWVTSPLLYQNPGPREVGEAWGFEYKASIIWDKVHGAGGNYTLGNHEILTIWTRGSCVPDIQEGLPDSVYVERKDDEHSAKPAYFRQLLERHWTTGPYLELFGRDPFPGWTVFGNDATLWAQEAAI